MKNFAILTSILLMAGCFTAPKNKDFTGEGKFDNKGCPTGTWTLYHAANNALMGKGEFVEGNPDGEWIIYDSAGAKIAELEFDKGKLSGIYRLFYGSFAYKNATGKLKTMGEAKNGILVGRFIRYAPDGSVVVDYTSDRKNILETRFGSKFEAKNQHRADVEYLKLISSIMNEATE